MERFELPDGWRWVKFGDVLEMSGGAQPPKSTFIYAPKKGYVRFLQIRDFGDKEVPTYIKESDAHKTCEENDILIARYGASVGKILTGKKGAYNVAMGKVIFLNDELDRRFVYYLLQSSYFQEPIRQTSRTAQAGFNGNDIKPINIPLPPLPEQHRIVKKIESLFAEARTARAALSRAEPLLKKFRQVVLSAAFRGELTERDANDEPASVLLERIHPERIKKWDAALRAKGKDATKAKFVEAEPPNTRELGELPEGWEWVNTAMLAADEPHSFTDGPFGSNLKTEDYVNKGVRVIRLQNLGVAQFKDKDKAYISKEKYATLRKHEVIAGDVVIAALGDPLGRTCIVPEGIGTAIVKADCLRLRVNPKLVLNKYVMFALNTAEHFRRAEAAAHGVGRVRANFSDVKAFVVPLAPLAEQQRIVERIEALFAQAEQIERAVEIARRRAEKVEQAILARAFRGELST